MTTVNCDKPADFNSQGATGDAQLGEYDKNNVHLIIFTVLKPDLKYDITLTAAYSVKTHCLGVILSEGGSIPGKSHSHIRRYMN